MHSNDSRCKGAHCRTCLPITPLRWQHALQHPRSLQCLKVCMIYYITHPSSFFTTYFQLIALLSTFHFPFLSLSLSLCVTQAAVGLQADQARLAGFTSGRKIPPCNNHHTPRYNPLLQSSYIQPQTSLSWTPSFAHFLWFLDPALMSTCVDMSTIIASNRIPRVIRWRSKVINTGLAFVKIFRERKVFDINSDSIALWCSSKSWGRTGWKPFLVMTSPPQLFEGNQFLSFHLLQLL